MARHRKIMLGALTSLLAASAFGPLAQAEETRLVVRVIAQGAKYVGDGMGGAEVTIRDARSGKTLASGLTTGSTGDTLGIMGFDAGRAAAFGAAKGQSASEVMARRGNAPDRASEGAAAYAVTLDIDEPTLLDISATGPMGRERARQRTSRTQWLFPGRHVDSGEAVTLELPGFAVTLDTLEAKIELDSDQRAFEFQATVTMMCGCPLTPGGIWDSSRFELFAEVWLKKTRIATVPLAYADKPSTFRGRVELPGNGKYRVVVYAFDPATGTAGLDRALFELSDGDEVHVTPGRTAANSD